ncbi:MAG: EAL domain-containing protein [Gammaproteobacteria bacterium]|nr:EAL domain-containing protein [Gammaproteobacteria bacterium]
MIPLRVLIVEDSEDDSMLLVRELKKGGYVPDVLRVDGPESMRISLESQQWDLIITDHNMPRFDSKAALGLVKESGLDVPVIIVSGSIGEELAVEAMRSGAHDYIMKDNLTRLVPAIRRELREVVVRHARREAEATIRHMAYHDALTNLVNRREFEHRLQHAITSAKHRGRTHGLLYLDLDQFKIINDTCGHMAGDELLKQLATRLQEQVRDSDTLARLGGDEFGVLLEGCPLERTYEIAEALRQAVTNFRFMWQGKPFTIGVCVGLVTVTSDNNNVDEVLSAADLACYAAKEQGRNRIHVYTKGDRDLAQRRSEMQWVARINEALENDQFVLYQQNIESLNGSQPGHSEFLIRLNDGAGGLVPPGAFIPAAERYNLMPTLDRWVIHNAFAHLSELRHAGNAGSEIEQRIHFINLSGGSLSDETLAKFIQDHLRQYELPAEMFGFEITETAAIINFTEALELINGVRELGCRFALDDFGSGLSSFSYLRSLPVDYLKIDGSFVRSILEDPMDMSIVEAINGIGHVAGLKTIAEFVENDAIKEQLQRIGVDFAQGYGIDKPHPLEDVATKNTSPQKVRVSPNGS